MNKKVLIQLSLFLTIFISCLIFYRLFFIDPNAEIENTKYDQESKKISKSTTNQINEITYKSKYLNNKSYVIKAEFAEFTEDNPDIMLLYNVKGKMFSDNSDIIEISSKKAIYNSVNYNTNFYENVLVNYNDHQINSDNFDLFFDKKISTIYNNVTYKSLNTTLYADKIDIDLITKNSKIYMLDKSKKVKIQNLN